MTDHVHERIGFREIDEHGNAVPAASPHVPEQPDPTRKRLALNPFIVALWVLNAGLAWFGSWALAIVGGAMMGPAPAQTAQLNFMILSNAPYALLAATLITAALLFWHAAQWQKRRA